MGRPKKENTKRDANMHSPNFQNSTKSKADSKGLNRV
jgi:hypothetical protein